jgi:hypothetical protein
MNAEFPLPGLCGAIPVEPTPDLCGFVKRFRNR